MKSKAIEALKAPLRPIYHAMREWALDAIFFCKRKLRKMGRRRKSFPRKTTLCVLCVKRTEYALLTVKNINSLHYLDPGYRVIVMTDDVCAAALAGLAPKLDYPGMVEVINRFDKGAEPWQFQKVKCLMEASQNGWVLVDADTIWHSEPTIDPVQEQADAVRKTGYRT